MTEHEQKATVGTILHFNDTRKKPRKIDTVLPWPPSEGLVKEMEQGLVKQATFALQLIIRPKGKSQDEVMRELENRRKL